MLSLSNDVSIVKVCRDYIYPNYYSEEHHGSEELRACLPVQRKKKYDPTQE
jgi:hypothetical protein